MYKNIITLATQQINLKLVDVLLINKKTKGKNNDKNN